MARRSHKGAFTRSLVPVYTTPPTLPTTQIALGRRHALFMTADCCVFGVGGNDFGQLGLGDTSRELVLNPARVEGLRADPRHLMCCGDDTSLVVGHDAVYAAGRCLRSSVNGRGL